MTSYNHTPRIRNSIPLKPAALAQLDDQRQQTVHEDSRLRDLGMAKRHMMLPTVGDAFRNKPHNDRLRILADYNIEPSIIHYLKGQKFCVLRIADTKAHGAPDDQVYSFAARYGAMLVSHDLGFTRFGIHNLEESPGVLILPQKFQKALEHFSLNMPHSIDHWRAKVGVYQPDRILAVHTLPFRPTILPEPLPTIVCCPY